jgi:hypothetical protein
MKISGHKDARIFARYNIVDTNDVAEAMRKVSQYEQEKRLARAKRLLDVPASLPNPQIEEPVSASKEQVPSHESKLVAIRRKLSAGR